MTKPISARPPLAPSSERESEERRLVALGQRRLMGNYRPAPFVLTGGHGCEVYDATGRRFLDFAAGIAVCSLGHAHPGLVEAIAEQAGRLMHVSNYFYTDQNVLLADELCAAAGFDRAFFCNSGAEANEALLKLARRHFWSRGAPRPRVIAFEGSFHGRTMATLALGGNAAHREGFGALVPGIEHVPYGDLPALRAAMGKDVAAIVAEPMQGEGGVVPAPEGFLSELRALADAHGALLFFDEVQTGVGRTGAFLASEGVRADAVSLAKGLGGGFPIGAVLLREELAEALPPGSHGTTFGGNPLASAAARAVLRALREESLVERARTRGDQLERELSRVAARHRGVCVEVRGRGLLVGLVLESAELATTALSALQSAGLLVTLAGGRVLRFTPPLVVTEAEILEAVTRVDEVLGTIAAARASGLAASSALSSAAPSARHLAT